MAFSLGVVISLPSFGGNQMGVADSTGIRWADLSSGRSTGWWACRRGVPDLPLKLKTTKSLATVDLLRPLSNISVEISAPGSHTIWADRGFPGALYLIHYVCIYTYIYIYTYIIHILYMYTYIQICIYTLTHIYIYTHSYTHYTICVYIYIYMWMYMYVCVCIYIYIYIYIYASINISTYCSSVMIITYKCVA